jgi:hypothetical protein
MADKEHILVHILEKVDRIEEHVSVVREHQAEIKADLRHHIKRTDLLECQVKESRKALDIMIWPFKAICAVLRILKIMR